MTREKFILITKGLVISVLLFATYWPLISQSFLFLLVFPCAVYFTFYAFEKKRYVSGLFYLVLSYIFNPIQPFILSTGAWILINTFSVIVVLCDLMWRYYLNFMVIDFYENKTVKLLPSHVVVEENKTQLDESLDRIFTEDYLNIDKKKESTDKLARKLVNEALFFAEQNDEDKAQEILGSAISLWDKVDKDENKEFAFVTSKVKSSEPIEVIKFDIGDLQSPEILSLQNDINNEITSGISEIYDLNSSGMESVLNTDFYELQGTKNKLTQFEIQNAISSYAEESKKIEACAFYWPPKSKKRLKGKIPAIGGSAFGGKTRRIKYLVGF